MHCPNTLLVLVLLSWLILLLLSKSSFPIMSKFLLAFVINFMFVASFSVLIFTPLILLLRRDTMIFPTLIQAPIWSSLWLCSWLSILLFLSPWLIIPHLNQKSGHFSYLNSTQCYVSFSLIVVPLINDFEMSIFVKIFICLPCFPPRGKMITSLSNLS